MPFAERERDFIVLLEAKKGFVLVQNPLKSMGVMEEFPWMLVGFEWDPQWTLVYIWRQTWRYLSGSCCYCCSLFHFAPQRDIFNVCGGDNQPLARNHHPPIELKEKNFPMYQRDLGAKILLKVIETCPPESLRYFLTIWLSKSWNPWESLTTCP